MKHIPVRKIKAGKQENIYFKNFSIRRLEDILDRSDLTHDLHRHDFYFLLAVEKGKGTHEIDFVSYKVANNAVFFLRPGQVHQLHLMAGGAGYIVQFGNEFYLDRDQAAKQRLRTAGGRNFLQADAGNFKKLGTVLKNVFDEYVGKEEGYIDVIKAGMDIFFIEYLRQTGRATLSATPEAVYAQERLEEFLGLLTDHMTSKKQVSEYTRLMNLSSYQLNNIIKTATGKTASAYIDEHIILEAKRHLLATSSQVKEIADRLGYEDVSYFIRFFKKHTGRSPEAFRKNLK